jgi:hypothetical protein
MERQYLPSSSDYRRLLERSKSSSALEKLTEGGAACFLLLGFDEQLVAQAADAW